MSSGQSLKKGSSVEPGLPNTFLMPKARSRSKVACLTVREVVAGLRDDMDSPHELNSKKIARHARPRAGHPRLNNRAISKTWMAGTSPAMTEKRLGTNASPRRGALHGG